MPVINFKRIQEQNNAIFWGAYVCLMMPLLTATADPPRKDAGLCSGTSNFEHNPFQETGRLAS
jgi:hypothetical protein